MHMLLINDVPLSCIHQAAVQYQVPAQIIVSVLKTEDGRTGVAKQNTNGSYDFGPMQINSIWLPIIAKYGYTQADIENNGCMNVKVGTWILSQSLTQQTKLWQGVGNYHSHTVTLNQRYAEKAHRIYNSIQYALGLSK
jgi:hypothetical protein